MVNVMLPNHDENLPSNDIRNKKDLVTLDKNKINDEAKNKHEDSNNADAPQPPTSIIYLMSMLSAMGGFLFGYDTGIVSGAMVFVRKTYQLNSIWQEILVSVALLGAWLFSMIAGSLSDAFGRKTIILVASVFFTSGSVIMGCAWSKWPLLVGRMIVGMAIGLASTVVPIYIAEVAPSNIRGSLVTLNNCFICFGQLSAAIIAGLFSYDNENGWRWMLSIAALPAMFQFLGFMLMPESPRWLLKQGRDTEALEALLKMRGHNNSNNNNNTRQEIATCNAVTTSNVTVDGDNDGDDDIKNTRAPRRDIIKREFRLMKQNSEIDNTHNIERLEQNENILISILRNSATRQALFVGCLLMAIQQCSGINTVMYYTATIIEMSGVSSPSMAVWMTVPTAVVLMLFSFLGYYLADRVGRRRLTLVSLFGVVVALVLLASGFYLVSVQDEAQLVSSKNRHISSSVSQNVSLMLCDNCSVSANNRSNQKQHGLSLSTWLVFGGIILYLAAFGPGMAPMPWTINSEIYPMWARGVCFSIATSVIWMFNMIISFTFLTLTEALSVHGAFLLYAFIGAIGWLLLYWKLPETKGKSLDEVSKLFEKKHNPGNKS